MTIGVETEPIQATPAEPARVRSSFTGLRRVWRIATLNAFSSLTRRIVFLNLAALAVLVGGILYLNQFREGLIDARVESLTTQGRIMATTLSSTTTDESGLLTIDPARLLEAESLNGGISPFQQNIVGLDFTIDPVKATTLIDRVTPDGTRTRVFDLSGARVADSLAIRRSNLPSPSAETGILDGAWRWVTELFGTTELPVYREIAFANGKAYEEVAAALEGETGTMTRVTERGELVVSVAVPIQRQRAVIGALLLQTEGANIDQIVADEREAILRVFAFAAAVTIVLSFILAGTIAAPLRRLAEAADKVRPGIRGRPAIPDYGNRRDEVGHLSRAIRSMTDALFTRIEAIERFAADVSHELKNPLTSLRSAVETLPLARSEESKSRLLGIIQHDVKRLDRLITDISDASRLDAELGRRAAEPVDVAQLLRTLVIIANETAKPGTCRFQLDGPENPKHPCAVLGNDTRLSQVFNNLIDNARSFSPKGGTVRIALKRTGKVIEATVEDDGPGIKAERIERIFERFYTDRPDKDGFGQHSGLGLSISKQIVEAHDGSIIAENRTLVAEDGEVTILGARFTVRLPANGG